MNTGLTSTDSHGAGGPFCGRVRRKMVARQEIHNIQAPCKRGAGRRAGALKEGMATPELAVPATGSGIASVRTQVNEEGALEFLDEAGVVQPKPSLNTATENNITDVFEQLALTEVFNEDQERRRAGAGGVKETKGPSMADKRLAYDDIRAPGAPRRQTAGVYREADLHEEDEDVAMGISDSNGIAYLHNHLVAVSSKALSRTRRYGRPNEVFAQTILASCKWQTKTARSAATKKDPHGSSAQRICVSVSGHRVDAVLGKRTAPTIAASDVRQLFHGNTLTDSAMECKMSSLTAPAKATASHNMSLVGFGNDVARPDYVPPMVIVNKVNKFMLVNRDGSPLKIDLHQFARVFHATYNPAKFTKANLIVRLGDIVCMLLVFRSGNVIIAGAHQSRECEEITEKFVASVQERIYPNAVIGPAGIVVCTTVASVQLPMPLNITALHGDFTTTVRQKREFPAVHLTPFRYASDEQARIATEMFSCGEKINVRKICYAAFVTGKGMLTGGRTEHQIRRIVEWLYLNVLNKYEDDRTDDLSSSFLAAQRRLQTAGAGAVGAEGDRFMLDHIEHDLTTNGAMEMLGETAMTETQTEVNNYRKNFNVSTD